MESAFTAHLNSWRASWMLPSPASSTPQAWITGIGLANTAVVNAAQAFYLDMSCMMVCRSMHQMLLCWLDLPPSF